MEILSAFDIVAVVYIYYDGHLPSISSAHQSQAISTAEIGDLVSLAWSHDPPWLILNFFTVSQRKIQS